MDMFFMLVSSILLLGLIAFTIALELENQKIERRAKRRASGVWLMSEDGKPDARNLYN